MIVVRPKGLMTAAVAVAAALTLWACGGGSGSSSQTAASMPTTASSGTSAEAAAPPKSQAPKHKGANQGPKKEAQPRLPQPAPSEVRKAGKAAGFLVGGGDNSVPTYGSEASGNQRRAAEAALAGFLDARAKEDWPTACSYLSASTRKRFEEFANGSGSKLKGCAPILKMFASSGTGSSLASSLTHALTSLRVNGDNAFALWVGPHGQKYAMPMVREGGAWRVTQIAPLPYPPGSAP